jgi:ATP-dependent protease Clp ATPase subunit
VVAGEGVQLALAIKIESAIADVGPPGLVLRGD